MANITSAQLQRIYPGANVAFLPELNEALTKYNITTPQQIAAFLAQALHESQGFTKLRESLNYSASRLTEVFPKRVPNLKAAMAIVAKGQVAIGDVVYGGRMGNGKDNGDGYKYRGGGLGGLTGKDNYDTVGKSLGIDLLNHPELIITPKAAIGSFCIFWQSHKCNDALAAGLATPVKYDGIDRVTHIVNGGSNGLEERRSLYTLALLVLK